jgi:4-hydroxyphenylacetate 3-monooxygenase reductase component
MAAGGKASMSAGGDQKQGFARRADAPLKAAAPLAAKGEADAPKAVPSHLTPQQVQYREAMARLSAAVHILTTDGPGGRCGVTASAVCSVTDDPPTLLVCINRKSAMNPVFKENGVLAVNTLRAGQEDLSALFAGQRDTAMAERFAPERWTAIATGSPVLVDALVSFDGRITDVKEIGTHSVMFVEVLDVAIREDDAGLVYFRRGYRAVQHNGG